MLFLYRLMMMTLWNADIFFILLFGSISFSADQEKCSQPVFSGVLFSLLSFVRRFTERCCLSVLFPGFRGFSAWLGGKFLHTFGIAFS
jgi:hypothetical protein